MATAELSPLYSELVELIALNANAEALLGYRLSDEKQRHLDSLLEKNRAGTLTPAQTFELDTFEQFEHMIRLLKARVRGANSP